MGQALASRSNYESFFKRGWRSNPTLLWLILIVVLLQLVVIYLPVLESFFHVDPLTALELLVCIVAGSLAFWAIELEKWWLRTKTRRVY
ncbi:MAG: cation-translocating P-type ATPase C-terminal domain-containing protein [Chloroflexi bacterium]|nr:cation-translocating P-type ATPase C-terminal domain-containing protein [Chloroflexota bacterium]